MIISKYSDFYPISFGDLHPEIQFSPLFIQVTVSLDAGIQIRWGKIQLITLEDDSFLLVQFRSSILKKILVSFFFVFTL